MFPLFALMATRGDWIPRGPALVLLTSYVAFSLVATWLRRYYRRSTQSMRLLLGFAALLSPFAAVYPMTAVLVERTTRSVIERDYAPLTAGQSDDIRRVLLETQNQIVAASRFRHYHDSRAESRGGPLYYQRNAASPRQIVGVFSDFPATATTNWACRMTQGKSDGTDFVIGANP